MISRSRFQRLCSLSLSRVMVKQCRNKNRHGILYLHQACTRCCHENSTSGEPEENVVLRQLKQRIRNHGPLTVADYMKEVLTNPRGGYYMHGDVFGQRGDFITSPEISQMFGEMIALWIIHEWTQLGCPRPFQVVELGPGRGTLAEDLLRVFSQFKHLPLDSLSLHLVEVSLKMSELQHTKLTGGEDGSQEDQPCGSGGGTYRTGHSKTGVPVSWYTGLSQVPKGFCCFIAHEFFDALPIHKFQKTPSGWREVLVDIDRDDKPDELRFVLSPIPTPSSTLYIKKTEVRDHVEVCPQAGVIVQEMANRIYDDGGLSLIVDYGHDGTKTDTFRGFKDHKLHDVLSEPGMADLTADVDFGYLRDMVGDKAATYGPVLQGLFLQTMGIETRLKMLLKTASETQQRDLLSGYKMLTDPAQMGERFKVFALLPKLPHNYTPAGFR